MDMIPKGSLCIRQMGIVHFMQYGLHLMQIMITFQLRNDKRHLNCQENQ